MEQKSVMKIGFDDTDSPKGMCTTFLAYKMVDLLKKENVEFLDFPYLIRFNPNIPWKTRGNGAVGIKIRTKNPDRIKIMVTKLLKKFSDTKNGANPGLVFYQNDENPNNFKEFSRLALWKLIKRGDAKKFAKKNNIEIFSMGNGQGLIGAIGAISYEFEDHTLELLSYRKKSQFGKKRKILPESVKKMQETTFPFTYNNYDNKKRRVLISPRGPDPVFFGIRGEDPKTLFVASKLIKTDEKLDGYLVFKSNQGTADHLKNKLDLNNLETYSSGIVSGFVSREPKMEKGGHVFFSLTYKENEILCAVYKPTGIGKFAMELIQGDQISVGGGIRKASKNYPKVLNLEFFKINRLEKKIAVSNPICEKCKRKMKSKGKNQGFQCLRCGKKSPRKITQEVPRKLKKKRYVPIVSAHRHLTRPEQRTDFKNKHSTFDCSIPWFHTYQN